MLHLQFESFNDALFELRNIISGLWNVIQHAVYVQHISFCFWYFSMNILHNINVILLVLENVRTDEF